MSDPWAVLNWIGLACAALPLCLTLDNLRRLRRPRASTGDAPVARVDVCIPARNEASNVEACVRSVLASTGASVRALVYDDESEDATPTILERLAGELPGLVRVRTEPLPAGWNGKQWGCERMGRASEADWLLFTDADVRLQPGAVAAAVAFAQAGRSDLVSTVPREICGTLGESLVVPLIHFMLLGYLPMGMMRRDARPAFGAGCGQFLLVRREAWARSGGHAAFAASMHDGLQLPRSIRRSGGRTDLFDGTALVECRMYRGLAQTWRGFAKNAYEGLGSPVTLLVFTALHLLGHVMPWGVLVARLAGAPVADGVTRVALASIVCGVATRSLLAWRFRQPWSGVLLHPVSMLLLTAIQWRSLWLARVRRRSWRGRVAG